VATIIRIYADRDDAMETYYEPDMTPALTDALAALRERGWNVQVEHVDADEERERLLKLAEEAQRQAASLIGASSAWLNFAVGAKYCESLVRDLEAAVRGQGSLLRQ